MGNNQIDDFVRDILEGPSDAFKNVVAEDLYSVRPKESAWAFGNEIADAILRLFGATEIADAGRIRIFILRKPSVNATWFPVPGLTDTFAVGINAGLVETIRLIANDIFRDASQDGQGEFSIGTENVKIAAPIVRSRLGSFLELGFPIASVPPRSTSSRNQRIIDTIVSDALRFVIYHEIAHVLLGHERASPHTFTNRFTDTQIATFALGKEHQADKLALRMLAATRIGSVVSDGMEFAGVALFFGVLGLFERHRNFENVFESPHAHPPAYERLFRAALDMRKGAGHVYWPFGSLRDGLRLARMDLPAITPEAMSFGDAVSWCLTRVLEEVETSEEPLYSPLNSLVNNCTREPRKPRVEDFLAQLNHWLFLGSPEKILMLLAELRNNAHLDASARGISEDDRQFVRDSVSLIDCGVQKVREIPSPEVQRGVGGFHRACQRPDVRGHESD